MSRPKKLVRSLAVVLAGHAALAVLAASLRYPDRPRLLSANERRARASRTLRTGRCLPRRPGTEHLRRGESRPLHGPGLRARAGALLADGLLAAHGRREALGDVLGKSQVATDSFPARAGLGRSGRAGMGELEAPRRRRYFEPMPTASTPTCTITKGSPSASNTACSSSAIPTTFPSPGRPSTR